MMIKKTILFATAIIISTISSVAQQTFSGKVVSSIGQPLDCASVVLLENNNGAALNYTLSKEDGSFIILLPDYLDLDKAVVVISSIGYKTLRIAPIPLEYKEYELTEEFAILPDVVVKADRPLVKTIAGGIELNIGLLDLTEIGTLQSLLSRLPTVAQTSTGELTVIGRGIPEIYINGRKASTHQLQSVHSSDVSSVRVINSPGAKYSTEALAVIEVITKSTQDHFSGHLYTDLEKHINFYSGQSLTLSYQRGKLGTELFLSNRFNNHVERDDIGINLPSEAKKSGKMYMDGNWRGLSHRGSLSFNYAISPKHQLGLMYSPTWIRPFLGGHLIKSETEITENGVVSNEAQESLIKDRQSNHAVNGYYLGEMSDLYTLRLDYDFYYSNRDEDRESKVEGDNLTVQSRYESHSKVRSRLLSARLQNILNTSIGEWVLGGSYARTNNSQKFSSSLDFLKSKDSQILNQQGAAFLSYNNKWGKFNINFGVRYEYNAQEYIESNVVNKEQSRYYHDVVPSFNLGYRGTVSGNISYRKRVSKPSYLILNNPISYMNPLQMEGGNPYVLPTYTDEFSLNIVKDGFSFNIAYNIHNQDRLYIASYLPELNTSFATTENIGTTRNLMLYTSYNKRIGVWRPLIELSYNQPFFEYQGEKHNKPMFRTSLRNSFFFPRHLYMYLDATTVSARNSGITEMGSSYRIDFSVWKHFFDDRRIRVGLLVKDIFASDRSWARKTSNSVVNTNDRYNDSRGMAIVFNYYFKNSDKSYKYKGSQSSDEIRRL